MIYVYRNDEGEERDFEFPLGFAPERYEDFDRVIWTRRFVVGGTILKGTGFYSTDNRKD